MATVGTEAGSGVEAKEAAVAKVVEALVAGEMVKVVTAGVLQVAARALEMATEEHR